ncbi:MAG: DUF134 domain-containing protein [Candidatus Moraniibacteriota bacterium]
MCRRIKFNPKVTYFKPRGVPIRNLELIHLSTEEAETLRLKDVFNLSQIECAKKMNTSQSTFQRILSRARKKVSQAIIQGKSIEIEIEK